MTTALCELRAANPADRCREVAQVLRRWIVEQSWRSGVGHIGSALSVSDILAVLWEAVMQGPATESPDRDRFILSKGHAALALYAILRRRGLLDEAAFRTYCQDGSLLGVHPEHGLAGVELSTGSLGQGLSVACGLALGLRLRGNPARVYILLSDAEINEGQVWEAAMFAGHHGLDNLLAIVDWNGMQALGRTRDVLRLANPLAPWVAFGWEAVEADGHDPESLLAACAPAVAQDRPRIVIARTVLGKGVSFMENRLEWHYRNLTDDLARLALAELEAAS
jgi:transketolase